MAAKARFVLSILSAELIARLIDGSLPWERATQLHIDAFLGLYTLHDSYWIGIHANCGWDDTAIAVIRFDPAWNSLVRFPTSTVADWPLLFLRFTCVNTIRLSGFRDNGGVQRGISSATVEHISDEESITTIDDHYGALVSLQHFPLIDALVMSANEDVVALSGGSM